MDVIRYMKQNVLVFSKGIFIYYSKIEQYISWDVNPVLKLELFLNFIDKSEYITIPETEQRMVFINIEKVKYLNNKNALFKKKICFIKDDLDEVFPISEEIKNTIEDTKRKMQV
eukprot:snap_masked-scaffold_2-processed-gene-11.28-mRNA-1 protein AED:1.00 eAED:1.00 QI:0/0/0/0/1/1/2/0/113